MSRVLKIIAILFIVIVLWITGGILMNRDKKPLHEQIAEYMFNAYAVPKLEYCVEKYGDEFILTDTGGVISTRFPGLQVYLRWSKQEKTYQDYYIVYIRQAELEEILGTAIADIFSQYKSYVLPNHLCPNDFDKNTTSVELLKSSDVSTFPLVQLWIYTDDDPSGRDIELEMLQKTIQELGYFLYVNVRYVSPENLAKINDENFCGDEALKEEFYRCIGSFYVSPDSFKWSITEGWKEGLG